MKRVVVIGGLVALIAAISSVFLSTVTLQAKADTLAQNLAPQVALQSFDSAPPALEKPEWYQKQVKAEQQKVLANAPAGSTGNRGGKTVTYTVTGNGALRGNLQEFAQLANATLNDPRGWAQLGVKFVQVPSGGQFNLILSQASLVPSYAPGSCSADWSCSVGARVIINDDRWMGATDAWNQGGGNLRDYRHMVVNHEMGHSLGHGHASCGGAGQLAPLMQQQSMSLQGCRFNPWPLPSEMWSTRI